MCACLVAAVMASSLVGGTRPPAISTLDDAREVVVVFEATAPGDQDVDLYAQRLDLDGRRLWGGGAPIAVGASDDDEASPALCDDGHAGVIIVYECRLRAGTHKGDTDLVARRLDKDGKDVWGVRPVPVASSSDAESRPVVVPDGQGGVIVVYEQHRTGTDSDILAQRLNSEGKHQWESAAHVGASNGDERRASVVGDGAGGVIVSFEWANTTGDTDVMAQRITSRGTPAWGFGQSARDVAASGNLEGHPAAAPDGLGGVIIAYEVEMTSGEYKGDVDIMAQRLDADGKLLWAPTGVVVSAAPGIDRNPAAAPDGAGGAFICVEFEPTSGENKGDVDLVAQRLDRSGSMQWESGKSSARVANAARIEHRASVVNDGEGGIIVLFESEPKSGATKGGVDLLAQRVGRNGVIVWAEGKHSVPVATSQWDEGGLVAVSDGRGGAIAIYATRDGAASQGESDICATLLRGDGTLAWNEGLRPLVVSERPDDDRRPSCAVVRVAR